MAVSAVSGLRCGVTSFPPHLHLLPSLLRRAAPPSRRAGSRVARAGLKGPAGVAGTGRGTLSVVAELRPGQPGLCVLFASSSHSRRALCLTLAHISSLVDGFKVFG